MVVSQGNLQWPSARHTVHPLLRFVQTKYNWPEATAASIDWEAHGTCLGQKLKRGSHFTKLVHDILPTHSWLNKVDKRQRTCMLCGNCRGSRSYMAMSGGGTQQMASCIFAKNVFFLCRSAHISAITNLIDGRLARVDVLGNNTGIRTASNSIPPPPSLIDIVAKSDRMASTFQRKVLPRVERPSR